MTMLNEDIVKELAKYDDLFNGFSYNDIIPERNEDEDEKEEETGVSLNPQETNGHIEENKSPISSSDSEEDVAKLEDRLKKEQLGSASLEKDSEIVHGSSKPEILVHTEEVNSLPSSPQKESESGKIEEPHHQEIKENLPSPCLNGDSPQKEENTPQQDKPEQKENS